MIILNFNPKQIFPNVNNKTLSNNKIKISEIKRGKKITLIYSRTPINKIQELIEIEESISKITNVSTTDKSKTKYKMRFKCSIKQIIKCSFQIENQDKEMLIEI